MEFIFFYVFSEPTEVEVEMDFNSFGSLDAAHMVGKTTLYLNI